MIREVNAKNDFHHEILSKQLVGLLEKRVTFNRAELRLMRDLMFELKINDEKEKK